MGRPAKPLITRTRAARAALGVIDVHGLDALNLELVARRLGVKAPSLYHHFSDKTALLEEVARLLLVEVEAPERSSQWDDDVIKLCVATRRSILRHPNAAPLLLQHFPRYMLLPSYEAAAATYPFPAEMMMVAIEGMEKLTFGAAFFEAAARARSVEPMPPFDPREMPSLAHAIRANPFDDDEQLFVATLRTFVAGLRAEVARLQESQTSLANRNS
jgi:AcrR family transcriptional regulator